MGYDLKIINGADLIGGNDAEPTGHVEAVRMRVASMTSEDRETMTLMGMQLFGLADPVQILLALRAQGEEAEDSVGHFRTSWTSMSLIRNWICATAPELDRLPVVLLDEKLFRKRMHVARKCAAEGCGKEGAKRCCGRCQAERYCSPECQAAAWPKHRKGGWWGQLARAQATIRPSVRVASSHTLTMR
jgi:hypothetical protein